MWPWAHAAVGYLLYTGYCRLAGRERGQAGRERARPSGPAVVVLALGAVLPDLVDKSLAWYVSVLPTGRSLGHSLIVGGVLVAAVLGYAYGTGRPRLGPAFAIGYLSHPLADGLHPFLTGEWQFLTYLAWPVLASPEYDGPQSVIARLAQLDPTPFFLFELALTAVALVLWAKHGYPGVDTVRNRVDRVTAGS